MEISSVPPGFESLVPFTLKRMEINQVENASESQNMKLETKNDCNGNSKTIRCRRNRRSVKYTDFDSCSGDESDREQVMFSNNCLPKGVIRGCETCKNCQKVYAKWHPEEALRPDLEEAPVFYPSEEEFEDTLKYMESIRMKAEKYGICRIVPPPSWKPPCLLKETNIWDSAEFSTRIQRIDKLQNRDSMRKKLQGNHCKRRKKRRCLKSTTHEKIPSEAESFGFEPGPDFTLDAFQKFADDFKAQFFRKNDDSSNSGVYRTMLEEQWQPSVEDIEGEYWRMVEKPTEEIEVLYGADVETGAFGSGFPKNSEEVASTSDKKYINSGWNLNNFPRLPGSVLSFESSDISGVVVPWLYIGMCFSSFCWHVEDHYLYSLNYMHLGAPKMWYGVPGSDALKLEGAMRKHLPELFEEQPDLLHKLVTQLSPSILRDEGVPVYRCVQNPGEFVLTFPRAYHAGFNCGFNCAEAVNVAPVDWLPHGHTAIELYCQQGRQTSISHDKLLLGAAREAVKANWEYNLLRRCNSDNLRWKEVCGKDGILSKAFKARVEMERVRREFLSKSSQSLKMESSFDATSERECSVCHFDLHLSAVGCHKCSPDKYACLNHAKQLCSCSWGAKFFLFRYDIGEMNILVEALEGKLSAVYRWARLDLGLALSSSVSKGNTKGNLSHTSQESTAKEMSSLNSEVSSKEERKHIGSTLLSQTVTPPIVVLALENVKASSNLCSQKVKSAKKSLPCKKKKSERKQSSFPENKGVVILSDDEGDECNKELSIKKGASEKNRSNNILNPDSFINNPAAAATDSSTMHEIKNNDPVSVCIKAENHSETERCIANPPSGSHVKFSSTDDKNSVSGDGHENNLDRYYRQKGPRIAKVVRRINCNVEPLDFGAVQAGKLWSDSQAIYPKGFRSRVKYIDVVDPTHMCYYVSEILDAGRERPLFMVSVEHSPNEVFIHVSASKCWEMVRERVNHEISKKHKLGRGEKLPPLQPPTSVDGMEMFGFSSPAILQVIQSMDQNRVCTEYWKSRPQKQIPQQSQSVERSNSSLKSDPLNDHATQPGIERILSGLFKKASPEELHTINSLLYDKNSTKAHSLLSRLLSEEINKLSR